MIEVSNGGQREGTNTHNFTAKDTDHSGVSESSGPLPAFPEQYMHFSYQECDSLHPSCLAAVLTAAMLQGSAHTGQWWSGPTTTQKILPPLSFETAFFFTTT